MLNQIDRNVWEAEYPLRYFGLSIRTRMTIVRSGNGELTIISPIPIDRECGAQIDRAGVVKHIIAPNLYHYFFVSECKGRYPSATVWAAPGLDVKQPDLPIDRILSEDLDDDLSEFKAIFWDGFRTLTPVGIDSLNEYVLFHSPSQTLILTDAAFNFDDSYPLLTQFAARLLGSYNQLSPSRLEQVVTTNRGRLKAAVETVLSWDFCRIVVAHGAIIERNAKEQFRQGYESFFDQPLRAGS